MTIIHPLEEIFHPKSIAVVGARGSPGARGYDFFPSLLEFGFHGKIYPVNPKYPVMLGIKTYPSLRDIPGSVDYVISCVPAREVLNILEDCSQKGVKCVHLYTARFAETGRPEAAELEQEILKKARKLGIRLIGPNCVGIYYPREGLSFRDNLPKEPGPVGALFQSGGLSINFISLVSLRGVYFSKAISFGNAIDLNECDFLDYLSQDPETKIILVYIEGVKDGKRFFRCLRQITPIKPVIILKGGRGRAGTRSAFSHTASLAGSVEIWESAVTQAGAISVQSLEEMIDLAVSFYFLPPIKGKRVGVAGGGGGGSVLAADQCEEAGLDVIPLPPEIREELKSKGDSTWDWISNPVDMSIRVNGGLAAGDMLQMMARNQNFDFIITSVGHPVWHGRQQVSIDTFLEPYKKIANLKPLLAIVADESPSSGDWDETNWKATHEMATELIAANIPFYPTIGRAARATRKLIDYYQRRG